MRTERSNGLRRCATCAWLAIALIAAARHAAAQSSFDLADLSVEELTKLDVTTASRTPQRASAVAAAVFVLSQDDIRRSGATTIPDALRLVPGLQVAQIDGNKWAVTARGFNSRVAGSLLVLMDGRTLYTATFGGVYWDTQDTMIEDIERIEVVRGPGGAVWGSNAFHGVINIITKHSAQTQGALIGADAGVERPGALSARVGGTRGAADWRVFAKGFERDANQNGDGEELHDTWRQARVGGRSDIAFDDSDTLRLSFEAYTGDAGTDRLDYYATSQPSQIPATVPSIEQTDGAFLSAQWSALLSSGGHLDISAALDYSDRDSDVISERRVTTEANLRHTLARISAHTFSWGFDGRRSIDTSRTTPIARMTPQSTTLDVYSLFAQDESAFFDERVLVTLGGKIEHNDYGGTSFLPSLRASYAMNDATLWGGVSKGVRAPTRAEHDIRIANFAPPLPPNWSFNTLSIPLSVELWGDPHIKPERVTAFEAGWRQQFTGTLSIDASTFYYDYSNVRGFRVLDSICLPSALSIIENPQCLFTATQAALPLQYASLYAAHAYGGELALSWNPRSNWRLSASYSQLKQSIPGHLVAVGPELLDLNTFFYGFDPEHQYSLRSSLAIGRHWEWDLFARHIDELPSAHVRAYSELNTRISWRPQMQLELALNGNNLLHDRHPEFLSDFADMPAISVERSVYVQLRWSFR